MKNMSVADLASKSGIAESKIHEYESGKAAPTLPEVVELSKALGADLRRLLEATGHVKDGAQEESMGIAAKFDGQLDASEKSHLRDIIRTAADKRRLF
jgi:transcriptional regulator with XRE-family HTH domain